MALTKLLTPSTKYLVAHTAFGQNNCSQALPVAMNALPPPQYWQFGPLFLCKLLQFSQILRVPSLNCCFQISPTGVQWDLDLDSLLATSEQSSMLSCSRTMTPNILQKAPRNGSRPMTFDGDPAF